MKEIIRLEHIGKTFFTRRQTITALQDVTMSFGEGEFVSIVGPSGCGKSTIIRMIDDIIKPTEGTITVNGVVYDNCKPVPREVISNIGFVFQSPNLYPWLTVRQNLLLPLKILGRMTEEYISYADSLLQMIGLTEYAAAYPREISGGMAQRIGVIRSMVHKPQILMMDEPFGALDDDTREVLDLEILQIWKRSGMTVIFITHNVEEAVLMSRKIYVMASHPGRVTAEVPIAFDQPRSLELLSSQAFSACCSQIEQMIGTVNLDQIV